MFKNNSNIIIKFTPMSAMWLVHWTLWSTISIHFSPCMRSSYAVSTWITLSGLSLCNRFLPLIFCFMKPDTLSTLLSKHLCYFVTVRDHVSHPYELVELYLFVNAVCIIPCLYTRTDEKPYIQCTEIDYSTLVILTEFDSYTFAIQRWWWWR